MNTTNRTISDNALPYCYHKGELGPVLISVRWPRSTSATGFQSSPVSFYESRSGSYTLTGDPKGSGLMEGYNASVSGTRNSYNFTVPVMAIFNFNVRDELRWGVRQAPTYRFCLARM